jgi:hypothetical protein
MPLRIEQYERSLAQPLSNDRNRTKLLLEALIRCVPERSMRLQPRFEIAEGVGDRSHATTVNSIIPT